MSSPEKPTKQTKLIAKHDIATKDSFPKMLETTLGEAGFSVSTENTIRLALLTLGLKICLPWSITERGAMHKGKDLTFCQQRAPTEEIENVD